MTMPKAGALATRWIARVATAIAPRLEAAA